MSGYLDESDSDEESSRKSDREASAVFTETEIASAKEISVMKKAEGDDCFRAKDYDSALDAYTASINALKALRLPMDSVIVANRAATYLALKVMSSYLNTNRMNRNFLSYIIIFLYITSGLFLHAMTQYRQAKPTQIIGKHIGDKR